METFSKGLHLLRKAIENSPDEFDAHIYLADTLIRSDSLAQTSLHEATRVSLRASEIRPHSARPFLCLARIRLRLGDIHGAAEFLRPVVHPRLEMAICSIIEMRLKKVSISTLPCLRI